MKYRFCVGLALMGVMSVSVRGDEPVPTEPTEPAASPPIELPDLFAFDARRAVHEGNRLLNDGKADVALEAYGHAKTLRPDAREIDFVEGLAHYDNKEFEKAREAFRKVSASEIDALGRDAMYGLGTCDHAEALDSLGQDPQLALSLLENAMKRYQEVLDNQPTHNAARDANKKAALMWRELKRQMQEQQQEKQQSDKECNDPQEQEKDADSRRSNTSQQSDQSKDQDQKEQRQESQSSESDEQQRPAQPDLQDEQQQQQSAQPEEQTEDQQERQATQAEEQASREQAERRLRQMMQAQRQRQKMRRQPVQRIPVAPVERDW